MMDKLRLAGGFIVTLALFLAVAELADWPTYRRVPEGSGMVMLSFVHGADRKAECRKLTPEELAKLPPNMRRPDSCPRGRRPLHVEFDIDGRTVFRAVLPPTGIAGDGPSRVYRPFVLPAGRHDIAVRLRDSPRPDGFDYAKRDTVTLADGQMFVVDFKPEAGGFVFR